MIMMNANLQLLVIVHSEQQSIKPTSLFLE